MSANFSTIPGTLSVPPGFSVRRASNDGSWEAYDARIASKGVSALTRALNTNYQPAEPPNVMYTMVGASIQITCTLSLTTGQEGAVALEMSADGSTDWQELARFVNGNTGTLAIGLNLVQKISGSVVGAIPPAWWYRYRTISTTGSPTFSLLSGFEAIYN